MRRLVARSAVMLALLLGLLAGAVPAYASTINSGSGSVNLRSGPGTNYPVVGSIANGAAVSVFCMDYNGTSVTGPFGTTSLWDEIGNSEWVTDAFVNTGTSAPIAMPCNGLSYGQGSILTNVVGNCDFAGTGGGSNYGSATTGSDWFYTTAGIGGCDYSYWYTYGNGPSASGQDYAKWGYYPGATATCRIYVYIPLQAVYKPFTSSATYTVYTNGNGSTRLGSARINQAANAGKWVDIGAWQADHSGYLRVQMDDSSTTGGGSQIVAANAVEFDCTSEY
jgi:hypothetical protein